MDWRRTRRHEHPEGIEIKVSVQELSRRRLLARDGGPGDQGAWRSRPVARDRPQDLWFFNDRPKMKDARPVIVPAQRRQPPPRPKATSPLDLDDDDA